MFVLSRQQHFEDDRKSDDTVIISIMNVMTGKTQRSLEPIFVPLHFPHLFVYYWARSTASVV
jgi:hypothetical protein